MTLKELSQLYWLHKEIAGDEARLKELRAAALDPGARAPDGVPRPTKTGDPPADYAARADALERAILKKQRRANKEAERLEAYISGIPDSLTRQIFTMRFAAGKSWRRVAVEIGGGNTEDTVRKRVYRYLRRH